MLKAHGYATYDPKSPLRSFNFERRDPGLQDVQMEILYCGVCHSDAHQVRDEWGNSAFPIVHGHEIVGRVVQVGSEVRNFKAGDLAGVGCMVDSCGTCPECAEGLEQYCDRTVFTYNSPDKHSGKVTYGGYSNQIVPDRPHPRDAGDA